MKMYKVNVNGTEYAISIELISEEEAKAAQAAAPAPAAAPAVAVDPGNCAPVMMTGLARFSSMKLRAEAV